MRSSVWPLDVLQRAHRRVDRMFTIVPPIAAFVAAGFEHCIANVYFVPIGLFIKAGAPDAFWTAIGKTPADFPALTWRHFLLGNLLPVTIGNIIGGSRHGRGGLLVRLSAPNPSKSKIAPAVSIVMDRLNALRWKSSKKGKAKRPARFPS